MLIAHACNVLISMLPRWWITTGRNVIEIEVKTTKVEESNKMWLTHPLCRSLNLIECPCLKGWRDFEAPYRFLQCKRMGQKCYQRIESLVAKLMRRTIKKERGMKHSSSFFMYNLEVNTESSIVWRRTCHGFGMQKAKVEEREWGCERFLLHWWGMWKEVWLVFGMKKWPREMDA